MGESAGSIYQTKQRGTQSAEDKHTRTVTKLLFYQVASIFSVIYLFVCCSFKCIWSTVQLLPVGLWEYVPWLSLTSHREGCLWLNDLHQDNPPQCPHEHCVHQVAPVLLKYNTILMKFWWMNGVVQISVPNDETIPVQEAYFCGAWKWTHTMKHSGFWKKVSKLQIVLTF